MILLTNCSDGPLFFPVLLQVIMANKEAAERACKEPNPIIDGRKANVNLAILGAKPRGNSIQGKTGAPVTVGARRCEKKSLYILGR